MGKKDYFRRQLKVEMLVGTWRFLLQVGGIGLLSWHGGETKKAREGHCLSKGRKNDFFRCKKKGGGIKFLTSEPTTSPTSAPTASPTTAPIGDLRSAVEFWLDNKELAESIYGNFKNWDVSKITDMDGVFAETDFNGDISSWNTDKVTSMQSMFYEAKSFNQKLCDWNFDNVVDTEMMFYGSGCLVKDPPSTSAACQSCS